LFVVGGIVSWRNAWTGFDDHPLSGRPRTYDDERIVDLHKLACQPADDHGRWSTRWLASLTGMSQKHVSRLLNQAALKPWQVKGWVHSPDPDFQQKARQVCRLYRENPVNSVVLSLDEKTAIQALSRDHAGRACQPGQPARRESEYHRHEIINLFAALDVRTGHVYSRLSARKRGIEFIAFLKQLDQAIDPLRKIILILDNISMHICKKVREYLLTCPGRFTLVHTPKHASWLNQVEIFFSTLTRQLLHHGNFASLTDLKRRIHNYINRHNHKAQPYQWKCTGYQWRKGRFKTYDSEH
jgi:hypothetical protein